MGTKKTKRDEKRGGPEELKAFFWQGGHSAGNRPDIRSPTGRRGMAAEGPSTAAKELAALPRVSGINSRDMRAG